MPVDPIHRQRQHAALMSLLAGFGMLFLKVGAWAWTGSAAVMSDALEAVVHVAATGFFFYCFHLAATPPDANHPYGHGKAEHLSVGFEGGMILVAAIAIVVAGIHTMVTGSVAKDLGLGFGLEIVAMVVNIALSWHLITVGRKTRSAMLVADGQHVLSDVWTTVGVLVAVVSMWVLPERLCPWIDGGVAIALAGLIVVTAVRLLRSALAGLLDEADHGLLDQVVVAINEIRDPNWLDIHNLRMRDSGDLVYVDFHLTLPSQWTISQGHEAEERLEYHILARLGRRGTVMIHLDHKPVELPAPGSNREAFSLADVTRIKMDEPPSGAAMALPAVSAK
jgi:cation diffusion facilitator family transporter